MALHSPITALVVLGPHRSGTSAFTRVLSMLGYALPISVSGASKGNEAGHWESAAIAGLNDSVLDELDQKWYSWASIQIETLGSLRKAQIIEDLANTIKADFSLEKDFILKDPRICRLTGILMPALKKLNVTAKIVVPIRNPLEVAESLFARDGISKGQAVLIWLRYILEAELGSRKFDRTFVRYDNLIDAAMPTIGKIIGDLNLSPNIEPKAAASDINRFLTPSLKHQNIPFDQVYIDPLTKGWVGRTMDALTRLTNESDNREALADLDLIRSEFNHATPFMQTIFNSMHVENQANISDIKALLAEKDALFSEEKQAAAVSQEKLDQQKKEFELLRKELSETHAGFTKSKDTWLSEKTNLLGEINLKSQDVIEKASLIQNLNTSVSELQKHVEGLDGRLSEAAAASAEKDQDISAKQAVIDNLTESVSELQKHVEGLDGRLSEAAAASAEKDQDISAKQAVIDNLTESVSELQKHVEDLDGQLAGAAATSEEMDRLSAHLDELNHRVKVTNTAKEALAEEVSVRDKKIIQLEGEISQLAGTLRQRSAELVERAEVEKNLEKDLKSLDKKAKVYEGKLHKSSKQLLDAEAHTAKLVADLTNERDKITALSLENSNVKSTIAALKVNLESVEEEKRKLETKRTKLSSDLDISEKDIEALTKEVARLSSEKDNLANIVIQVSTEKDELTTHVVRLSNETADLAASVAQISSEKAGLTENAAQLSREKDELTASVVQLSNEKADLLANVGQISKEKDELTASMTQISNEKAGLVENAAHLLREKDELTATVAQLSGENTYLSSSVDRLAGEKEDLSQTITSISEGASIFTQHASDEKQALNNEVRHLRERLAQEQRTVLKPAIRRMRSFTGKTLRMVLPNSVVEKMAFTVPTAEQKQILKMRAAEQSSALSHISVENIQPSQTEVRVGKSDIFVFAIIGWHFRTQRPQHIAKELCKLGHRVFYFEMDPPGAETEIEEIMPNLIRVKLKLNGAEQIPAYTGTPDAVQQKAWLEAFYSFCDEVNASNHKELIIQHPFWWQLAKLLPPEFRTLNDCMDDIAGFDNTTQELIDLEYDFLQNVDDLVVSSTTLYNKYSRFNPLEIIRNGTELHHFQNPDVSVLTESFMAEPLTGGEGPVIKVGYVGAISDWFDTELLRQVARVRPDIEFHLCGNVSVEHPKSLAKEPNVKLYGEIPYVQVPAFLQQMDVLIIPFRIIPIIRACDPVKFYEYSTLGKPTVTTPLPELDRAKHLAFFADGAEEFSKQIDAAFEAKDDEDFVQELKDFAAQNTWTHRAQQFSQIIDSYPKVSVVILAYGDPELTNTALHSLMGTGPVYPNMEIIIVDNGSSEEALRNMQSFSEQYQNTRIIANGENLGFAGGNNVGLEDATGDYVILLNNDTYVSPGAIYGMMRHLQKNPKVGAVGPLTNNIGNEAKVFVEYDTMDDMIAKTRALKTGYRGKHIATRVVAYFAVMFRNNDLKKFGLLSTDYGRGMFEDDDHCHKIRQDGYECVVAEDAFVHHHLSATFSKMNEDERVKLFNDNKATFERKWGPWQPHEYRHGRQPSDILFPNEDLF